jgi:hypothetical protein
MLGLTSSNKILLHRGTGTDLTKLLAAICPLAAARCFQGTEASVFSHQNKMNL